MSELIKSPPLCDNQFAENRIDVTGKYTIEQITLLKKYSGCTLEELQDLGVQVMSTESPHKDHVAEDYWVYRFVEKEDKAYLETSNAMGVIRFRDNQNGADVMLQIISRFDTGDHQFFLVYLLSRVFGGEFLRDMDIPAEGPDMWDFLIALLFRKQLSAACELGLYREYHQNHHNDLRYRGKFEIDTHLKRNTPFVGNIAYTTRDISFDNPLNHLIRHALEKTRKRWPFLLTDGYEFTSLIHLFEQNTPTWQQNTMWSCVHDPKNRQPLRHPLYAAHYEPLRILSRALLHEEGAHPYSNSGNEVEGFLFDGAWLWEEYLNSILEPLGFNHPRNKDWEGGLFLFQKPVDRQRFFFPDFWRSDMVVDAKYKKLNQRNIEIEDLCQMISYMYRLQSDKGIFIYPESTNSTNNSINIYDVGTVEGYGGKIQSFGIQIPLSAKTQISFMNDMVLQEKILANLLERL